MEGNIMNYNNFGGYSNGRYFANQPYAMPSYQPTYMPQTNQDQNGIMFNHIRYVNSNEMSSYVVLPNNTDMIIDKANNIVQIKSADQVGNSFTRNFKFEEITDLQPTNKEEKQPEIDLSGYVKTEDLKDFIKVDALDSFSKQLDEKFSKIEKQLEKQIKINNILGDKE